MGPDSRTPPTHCFATAVAHLAGVGRRAVLVHPARLPMPTMCRRILGSNRGRPPMMKITTLGLGAAVALGAAPAMAGPGGGGGGFHGGGGGFHGGWFHGGGFHGGGFHGGGFHGGGFGFRGGFRGGC